jgi:hypothetical protein
MAMFGNALRHCTTSGPVNTHPIDGGMAIATRPCGVSRIASISDRAWPTSFTTLWA